MISYQFDSTILPICKAAKPARAVSSRFQRINSLLCCPKKLPIV